MDTTLLQDNALSEAALRDVAVAVACCQLLQPEAITASALGHAAALDSAQLLTVLLDINVRSARLSQLISFVCMTTRKLVPKRLHVHVFPRPQFRHCRALQRWRTRAGSAWQPCWPAPALCCLPSSARSSALWQLRWRRRPLRPSCRCLPASGALGPEPTQSPGLLSQT